MGQGWPEQLPAQSESIDNGIHAEKLVEAGAARPTYLCSNTVRKAIRHGHVDA